MMAAAVSLLLLVGLLVLAVPVAVDRKSVV